MSETKPHQVKLKKPTKTKPVHTPTSPVQPPQTGQLIHPSATNNYAVTGFIVSLLGIVVPGFVLSLLGIMKAKEKGGVGKGLGIAGVVISGVWLIVWMLILFAIMLLAKQYESPSSTYTTKRSYENLYTLRIPSSMVVQNDMSEVADMQYSDARAEVYAMTINELRSDFEDTLGIDGYSELAVQNFGRDIENYSYEEDYFGLSVLPSRDFKMKGSIGGLKVIYYVRFVELDKHFVQIIAWTRPSKEEDNKDTLQTIVSSIKET